MPTHHDPASALNSPEHQELERQRNYYRQVMELASDGIFIMSHIGKLVDCNKRAADLLGYTMEEMLTLSVYDWDKSLSPHNIKTIFETLGEDTLAFETQHTRKDGTIYDAAITTKRIHTEDGTIHYAAVRDISHEKALNLTLIQDKNFIDSIIDNANAVIAVMKTDGTMSMINRFGANFTGYTTQEIASTPFFWVRFLPDAIQDEVTKLFNSIMSGKVIAQHKNAWVSKTGQMKMFEWSNNLVYNEHHEVDYLLTIGIDVTDSENSKQDFKTIFDLTRDGLALVNLDSEFLDFNDAYLSMTGFTRAELLQKSCIGLSVESDQPRARAAIDEIREKGFLTNFEKSCYRKDGSIISVNMSVALMPDKQRMLISTKDVTQTKQLENELRSMAHYDVLTHIPNRYLLNELIAESMALAVSQHQMLAVLYIDLDGFKQVNDVFGHDIGDQLLVAITQRITQQLPAKDTIARLGGDEFIVLLNGLTAQDDVTPWLSKLLALTSTPVPLAKHLTTHISASIGVTFFSPASNEALPNAATLLRQADQAMYAAKIRGKNQFAFYTPSQSRF